jgi:hypothetical protein
VGSVFSSLKIKRLSDIAGLFSTKGLAVLAFLMIFFVFALNTSLCPDSRMKKLKPTETLIPGEVEDNLAPHDDSMLDKVCRLKNSLTMNVTVAFLVLTVVRQVMVRLTTNQDRIKR